MSSLLFRRAFTRVTIAGLAIIAMACEAKSPSFFDPRLPSLVPRDNTPFAFSNSRPLADDAVAFATREIKIDASDLKGPNGATPTGVNWSTLTATVDDRVVPFTRSGPSLTASLATVPDGRITYNWKGADSAGNLATATGTLNIKNTSPVINLTSQPLETIQSSSLSEQVSFNGTMSNAFLATATGSVRLPGPGNTCSATGALVPSGYTLATVNENAWDYTTSVKGNGTFTLNFTANTATVPNGPSVTTIYCIVLVASDAARDINGAPKPNETTRFIPIQITWNSVVSQTGRITASVTVADGTPVPGIVVIIATQRVNTDRHGNVVFTGLAPGNYIVTLGANSPAGFSCPAVLNPAQVIAGQTAVVHFTCTRVG